jgi:hypothetical protein
MVWRIHESVIRGEVDNRERGFVRGRLWLEGIATPVVLELTGNAWPDLAGCLLTFENPAAKKALPPDANLATLQRGTVGDLTASRKIRIWDLAFEEGCARKKQGLPVPEHIANSLYLEWYSECSGRVVIESTEYTLTISEPAWRPTQEEEEDRKKQSAEGFEGFMAELGETRQTQEHQEPEEKPWDEFDYEKFLRECDARTEQYGQLLEKYKDHPDRDQIVAREMGWTGLKDALETKDEDPAEKGALPGELVGPDAEQGSEGDEAGTAEEPFELEPDPATEGVDWVRGEDGFLSHPLVSRTTDGGVALMQKVKELGLLECEDAALRDLVAEYQITGSKLAGALNGLAYGRGFSEAGFVVACLKRALGHLHAAQTALEKVAPKNLLPPVTVASVRTEFFALREEILRLMEEFRGRL